MKILQINSVCGIGSTGRIVVDLYKSLEKQGYECVIAYGRGEAPKEIKTIKIGRDFNNYLHVAKTRVFDKHGFGSTKATKEFIKKIEEYNPDVIHLHNIHGYYINIKVLFDYLKRADKKVVWTLHDCWAFTGHCAYFDYIGCSKWKNKCNKCQQKSEYPKSLIFDNSESNFNEKKEIFTGVKNLTIVTPSKWLAGLVKESYLSQYRIKVINNGVDLDVFKPIRSNFRVKYGLEDKFVILGVANIWDRRKGLNYLIKLAEKLDENHKVIVVGVTEKQKEGLPENIIGISKTNNVKELVEIYSNSDVFINPTLEDNFPTTNLEALACGSKVITFNTGGSIECINDNNGIIVDKNDFNGLLKAVENIKNVKILDKSYKKYNKELCYLKYKIIYDSKK